MNDPDVCSRCGGPDPLHACTQSWAPEAAGREIGRIVRASRPLIVQLPRDRWPDGLRTVPATPEMIADPTLGACMRMRDGCIELGPWRSFYQGYVCEACLRADQAQLANGE